MNILIFTNYAFPVGTDSWRGGIEYFIDKTKLILESEGHTVDLVVTNDSVGDYQYYYGFDSQVVSVFKHNYYSTRISKLKSVVDYSKYDLVISNVSYMSSLKEILKSTSSRVINILHGLPQIISSNPYIIKNNCRLLNELKSFSNLELSTVSHASKCEYDKFHHNLVNSVISPYFDLKISSDYKIGITDYNLYVGRLNYFKIRNLVHAYLRSSVRTPLKLIGSKYYKNNKDKLWFENLSKLIESSNGLVSVINTQNCVDLLSYIKNANCLIQPNPCESFSFVTYNAQKLGVPVIVNNSTKLFNSGTTDYVTSTTGVITTGQFTSRTIRDSLETVKSLNRVEIFDHFNTHKYTNKAFYNSLLNLL